MTRPHKKAALNTQTADDLAARQNNVEQLIKKGREKEAFKLAKLYFHQDASPEHRQLVERTYLLRIQALIRDRMISAGREVALNLLEFGAQDAGVKQELALLLPQVGLADKAAACEKDILSPEVKSQLLGKIADQVVLHPEQAVGSLAELHEAASSVRAALAALESDNEAQALALLQPIPRGSPLADWRYFVRGLAAYRHADLEQANANWQRLDPQRASHKIAQTLLTISDQKSFGGQLAPIKKVEAQVFGEPILERFADLRNALETNDWKRAIRILGPLQKSLHRLDSRYAQRLTEIILLPLAAAIQSQSLEAANRLIGECQSALEPLAVDPKWNRFQALLWEGSQGSPEQAIQFWRKYLQDLDQGLPIPGGQVRQVQALVWRRIGELCEQIAEDEVDEEFVPFRSPMGKRNAAASGFRTQAVEALKQSLRFDPTLRATHQRLIDHYSSEDQSDLLVKAIEQLLAAFPDDIDALRLLIETHIERDEPEQVLRAVERLRAIRPLDPRLNSRETWGRLALARHHILNNRWEEGRAELAHVEASLLKSIAPYRVFARRAALEFKAGNAPLAEQYIERGRAELKEPTPLWLTLAIEAERGQLPQPFWNQFNREFEAAVARKVTSETAGELAKIIASYSDSLPGYPSRPRHVQSIVSYLRRTTRTRYREEDLQPVCGLLQKSRLDDKLLATLVKRGQKLFPRSPFFAMMEVEQDIAKGPAAFNGPTIRKKLEKALALAQGSPDTRDTELISHIKATLAQVQDMTEAMASLPFMPGGMPRTPEEFNNLMNMVLGQFDDEESDFDDEQEFNHPKPPSKQPPKRKRR